jgi:hypothetical protein
MVRLGSSAHHRASNSEFFMSLESAPPIATLYAGLPAVEVKPAARVWTDPMPETTPERLSFFQREGFLILRGMLTPAELAELEQELDRIARNHASMPRIREGFDLEPTQVPNQGLPTFRKIGGISDMSPAFARLLKHPQICGVLAELMGDKLQLYRDVVMMKPAFVGREKPWHQDSVYWPWQPMQLVSALTALDDADETNGCLQIIPGSHEQELQHYGKELQVDIAELQSRARYVPLRAGDTLLFHSLLLHASEPNRSNRHRRVVINSYKTPRLKFVGKGEPGETPTVWE